MSEKGRQKKFERLVKKANRQLLAPSTPHDKKIWKKGVGLLLKDLALPEEIKDEVLSG